LQKPTKIFFRLTFAPVRRRQPGPNNVKFFTKLSNKASSFQLPASGNLIPISPTDKLSAANQPLEAGSW
jgi:hypothetical protein